MRFILFVSMMTAVGSCTNNQSQNGKLDSSLTKLREEVISSNSTGAFLTLSQLIEVEKIAENAKGIPEIADFLTSVNSSFTYEGYYKNDHELYFKTAENQVIIINIITNYVEYILTDYKEYKNVCSQIVATMSPAGTKTDTNGLERIYFSNHNNSAKCWDEKLIETNINAYHVVIKRNKVS
jgi:hypothetical protein